MLLLWLAAALLPLLGGGAAFAWLRLDQPRSSVERLRDYRPPLASIVLDRHGRQIGEFFFQRRRLVGRDDLPDHVIQAFVAAEDGRFYAHAGLDYPAILRAGWANLRGGRIEQGASTITQQLVKNVLLTPERSWRRKLREMFLARNLEQRLSKDEILLLYLNHIYFGNGAYGIAEAARSYFAKRVDELDLSEAALLAGLPQRPSAYSPTRNACAAEARRRYVLKRMLELGFVSAEQQQRAWDLPPHVGPRRSARDEPTAHFVEEVRRALIRIVGADRLHRDGLVIETTLDLDLQKAAWAALRTGLEELEQRQAARRGLGMRVDPLQDPGAEGALLSLHVPSGDVLAMVGGYDFSRSEFNRAVQARRQPGSAFKPLIYAAAIEAGYSQASFVLDAPNLLWDQATSSFWRPRNYGRRFLGWLTLRRALSRSVNNASIRLLRQVGEERVIELAQRLGIRSPLTPYPSLALGTDAVSLLELTRAYAAFPAGGERVRPRFVKRVLDPDGWVLARNVPLDYRETDGFEDLDPVQPVGPALEPSVAGVVTDLLKGVVHDPGGTGRRARHLGAVAGKTGTTNDNEDAWFVGFSPTVTTGVWVGFDRPRSLGPGETGGRAALPIWTAFMEAAAPRYPSGGFPIHEGMSFARVDRATGRLAGAANPRAVLQAFVEGSRPHPMERYQARLSRRERLLDF
jgi:penicillin-binding protein 1A